MFNRPSFFSGNQQLFLILGGEALSLLASWQYPESNVPQAGHLIVMLMASQYCFGQMISRGKAMVARPVHPSVDDSRAKSDSTDGNVVIPEANKSLRRR